MAVLPTPGSPIRQGLFLFLLDNICTALSISFSLPTTLSSLPKEASFADEHVRNEVFRLLKEYALKNQVQFLRVDPNVIRCHRTITGDPVDDGFSNECVTEELKELGYTHKGYGYAYNGSWTNRYTLFVDLNKDMKDVIAGYAKPRKTALNRHAVIGVSTRIGNADDLPSLMDFEVQLSEQDGFKPHSRKFFEALLESFGEHAVIYVKESRRTHQ